MCLHQFGSLQVSLAQSQQLKKKSPLTLQPEGERERERVRGQLGGYQRGLYFVHNLHTETCTLSGLLAFFPFLFFSLRIRSVQVETETDLSWFSCICGDEISFLGFLLLIVY